MTKTELITGEAARPLSARRHRLVRHTDIPHPWGCTISPFLDETWRLVPVADWVSGFESMCINGIECGEGGWPQRGDLPDLERNLDVLMWHLKRLGRDRVIVSHELKLVPDIVAEDRSQYCVCPADAKAVHEACVELAGFGFRSASGQHSIEKFILFDEHEDWSAVDSEGERHFLGGTPEFIEGYCETAGGEEFVRAWFYWWDIIGPITTDWEPFPPSPGQKAIYDLVGWPIAPYADLKDGDIDWAPTFGDRIKSCGPRTWEGEITPPGQHIDSNNTD